MTLLNDLMNRCPGLIVCKLDIQSAVELLTKTYQDGGKLLLCGNGGSSSDCEHIVGELMKNFMVNRKITESARKKFLASASRNGEYIANHLQGALPAISLGSHTSLVSAFSNDTAADLAFAQQVYGYGKPEDCFLGISTSGNSANIVYAAETAKALGLKTIALTGAAGGMLGEVCDVAIKAPSNVTPHVQEHHVSIYHTVCMILEETFFPAKSGGI